MKHIAYAILTALLLVFFILILQGCDDWRHVRSWTLEIGAGYTQTVMLEESETQNRSTISLYDGNTLVFRNTSIENKAYLADDGTIKTPCPTTRDI